MAMSYEVREGFLGEDLKGIHLPQQKEWDDEGNQYY